MKIKRICAGVYEFENKYGLKGELLKQPEGGWSVWDTERSQTLDYAHTKAAAKAIAESLDMNKGRV